MCYAKPGPRCSGHAKANLERAVAAGDPVAILVAGDAYDETVKGQREIKAQLAVETGDRKHELQARLNSAKYRRKLKLAQYKNLHPDTRITHDGNDGHQQDIAVVARPENIFYSQEVADMIRDGKITGVNNYYLDPSAVGIEKENPGCSGCEEPYDDFCRCTRYDEYEFEVSNIDAVMRSIVRIDDNAAIPPALNEWALKNGFDTRSAYYINISGDYYGDEISISLNSSYFKKAQDYFDMHKRAAEAITVR